jgi:hypothetical protein
MPNQWLGGKLINALGQGARLQGSSNLVRSTAGHFGDYGNPIQVVPTILTPPDSSSKLGLARYVLASYA